MIKRFVAGLTSPAKTVEYINDKWYMPLLVLLFMAIIYLIPAAYYSSTEDLLNYEMQKDIRSAFQSSEVVEYIIHDGKLEYLGNDQNKTTVDTTYGRFIFTNTDIVSSDLSKTINLVFKDEGISFVYGGVKLYYIPFSEYDQFEGLPFGLAKVDNVEFWNRVFTVANEVLESHRLSIAVGSISFNIGYMLLEIFICAFFVTLIAKMSTGLKFWKVFKLGIYISVPTFVGLFMATIYSVYALTTIGMVWTFAYAYRLSGLLRNKGGF